MAVFFAMLEVAETYLDSDTSTVNENLGIKYLLLRGMH